MISKIIFRQYDIRGIVNKTLTIQNAYYIGRGFCSLNSIYKLKKIVVCRDGRLSSPDIANSLIKGVLESGINVVDIGCGPTPMLYFASNYLDCDAGIMVTGSHNPADHNGFKLVLKNKSFFGKDLKKLYNFIIKSKFIEGAGVLQKINVKKIYEDCLLKESGPFPMIKVIWDCGNGATGEIISSLVKRLPGKHEVLFSEIDGTFPNHHPDPSNEKNLEHLKNKMGLENADLGISFDGDGDRIGIISKDKRIIPGDVLTAFLAGGVINKKYNDKILLDIKCSNSAIESIKEQGGISILYKTGHSNIKSKLKEINAPLAGEVSGHIFFNDKWNGIDDALYAALRVLQEIKRRNIGVSKFQSNLNKYFTSPEIRIDCDDNEKFNIVKRITSMALNDYHPRNCITIDGIRVNSINGWWLIRASNTQGAIIIRAEATDKNNFIAIMKIIVKYLKKFNITLNDEFFNITKSVNLE